MVIWERVAAFVGIGYLICALLPRLLSSAGVLVPLAAFYWSLPGALLGGVTYASWTGFRGRAQSVLGMVIAGAIGVLLTGVAVVRLPVTIRPFAQGGSAGVSFFGGAAYEVLCDLSAIVFLFALFLAAYVPAAPPAPAEDDEGESAAG
jgi:hypothetical protein